MIKPPKITVVMAKKIGSELGINWSKVRYTPMDLKKGMKVEFEHGRRLQGQFDVTHDNLKKTAKIALMHLHEDYRYYIALEYIEKYLKSTK